MKEIIKYISFLICFLPFMSCSVEEVGVEPSDGTVIEFIARPTSFTTCDVATKAAAEPWESEIKTSYMLLYNDKGVLELEPVALGSNPAYKYAIDGKYTVCFLANVPSDFMEEGDFGTLDKLQEAVVNLEYSDSFRFTDSEGNDITPINVPYLDLGNGDEVCMPMFGMATNSSISKSGNKAIVTLERLFAKVNLTITVSLKTSTGYLNRANFDLDHIYLSDVPKKVSLTNKNTESEWVTSDEARYDGAIEDIGVVIYDGSQATDDAFGIVNTYTCSCYIPEYILNPKSDIVNSQNNKPSNYDSSKYPVFLTIDGGFSHPNMNNGNAMDFIYTIYLGEDTISNFSLKRNKAYNYTMTITGINDARLEIDERVDTYFPVENLGSQESANCYVISQIGRYKFPAVKGNTAANGKPGDPIGEIPVDEKGNITNYELITDNTSNTITNIKLDKDGMIRFDVNMDKMATVKNGNTMLIIKDVDGNVLWSWHLWFDGGVDALANEQNPISEELYNTGYTMMNRNLGSASQRGAGFYYKWGDKSPFFKGAYQGGITGGEWGATKSVTDPCPPGYKVPSSNVWSDSPNEATIWGSNFFTYEGSPLVLYPYSSYIEGTTKAPFPAETVLRNKVNTPELNAKDYGLDSEMKFKLNHSYSYKIYDGALWSIDMSTYYKAVDEILTIHSGTIYRKKYVVVGSYGWYAMSSAELALVNISVVQDAIIRLIKSDYDVPENVYDNKWTQYDNSHGLQVRCVKE